MVYGDCRSWIKADGFGYPKVPDDEELGEIKCRKQGVFKQFKRLKFVFYDRVTTNDES